jgi:hypothetical protein|tara:strand:- start:3945 stop:4103 length:159 start_codon:yes stop_codon:yes gene_type:complete
MKKSKKFKKLVVIESKNEKKLSSFLTLLKAVAEDMGLTVSDGEIERLMGSDY